MDHSLNTMSPVLDNVKSDAKKTTKRKQVPNEKGMELANTHILASLELPFRDEGSFDLKAHELNCFNIINLIIGKHTHGNGNGAAIKN